MKLLVLSDLHLELGTSLTIPRDLEFDVALLPGDIHSPGHKAIHWARRESTFGGKPVVFVPGNHEFYRAPSYARELEAMRQAAESSNVRILDRDCVVIDGVRFAGCTLWTDFQLPIHHDDVEDTDIGAALERAGRSMNDFRLIQIDEVAPRERRYQSFKRLLQARDTLAMHWIARDWLRRTLKQPFDGPTVVATHHAPSVESVAAKYAGHPLTPAFVSHLPDEFFGRPSLWVHGHTHSSSDYRRGNCNVIANPRGYRLSDGSFENPAFDSRLVVELLQASSSALATSPGSDEQSSGSDTR